MGLQSRRAGAEASVAYRHTDRFPAVVVAAGVADSRGLVAVVLSCKDHERGFSAWEQLVEA